MCQRASFSAASSASAPLLVKNTFFGVGPGATFGQPLGEVDLRPVVEVGAGHVEQLVGLVLDRGDDLRVAVAGGGDGDAGGEVEEQVAVHVLDDAAAAALDDQRIDAACTTATRYASVAREQLLRRSGRAARVRMSGTVRSSNSQHGSRFVRRLGR